MSEFSGGKRETPHERNVLRAEKANLPPFGEQVDRFLRESSDFLENIQLTVKQMVKLKAVDPMSEASCERLAIELGIDTAVVGALKMLYEQGEAESGATLH